MEYIVKGRLTEILALRFHFRVAVIGVLVIFTMALQIPWVNGQSVSSVESLCDVSFQVGMQRLPQTFLGTIYNVSVPSASQSNYRLSRASQTGVEVTDIPIPLEWYDNIYPSEVSPNGEYLLFEPLEATVPLVVWKIDSAEFATISLSASDFEYIEKNVYPIDRQVRTFDWITDEQFVLRYFDLTQGYESATYTLADKIFSISENPFEIIEGQRIEIPYLNIGSLYAFPYLQLSPQENYISVVSTQNVTGSTGARSPQLDIYSALNGQLVTQVSSTLSTRLSFRNPTWALNDQSFFYRFNEEGQDGLNQTKIGFVVVEPNVQQDFTLQESLEQIDSLTSVSDALQINYDSSGTRLAFHIYQPTIPQQAMVVYEAGSGITRIICDPMGPTNDLSYAVWDPNSSYAGYWSGGQLVFFDVVTGEIYAIDASGFVGWIQSGVVLTPTPIATSTPTETPADTPTSTTTPSPTLSPPPTATPSLTPTPPATSTLRIEAESYTSAASGVTFGGTGDEGGGEAVYDFDSGRWIAFTNIDLLGGVVTFRLRADSPASGNLSLRLGSATASPFCTLAWTDSGGDSSRPHCHAPSPPAASSKEIYSDCRSALSSPLGYYMH